MNCYVAHGLLNCVHCVLSCNYNMVMNTISKFLCKNISVRGLCLLKKRGKYKSDQKNKIVPVYAVKKVIDSFLTLGI